MDKTEILKTLLENVSDSYEDFVVGGMRSAEKREGYAEKIIEYILSHPKATTSDIIQYETEEIIGIKPVKKNMG
ncbi:MAG: hypothetical protein IJY83_08445 [Oscillospiraceae bacterium]|nr:hypothetical protein [Oscillospiraceae bacterium]